MSFTRLGLWAGLVLGTLAMPAQGSAQTKAKDKDVPRLGLDLGEPGVRSAPPSTPFGIAPATSKDSVLDFHGYLLVPMNLGVHDREATLQPTQSSSGVGPVTGLGGTVLHTPPFIPQDYGRFQFTGVVPTPWIQLNLSYGNSIVAGTVIIASTAAYDGEAVYDPVRQIGVSNAFITLNLSEKVGTPFQIRAGAMQHRYGAMGAFDAGHYATPLIAQINAIGEVATASVRLGDLTLVLEEGFGGQLGRMPSGMASEGWNDFGDTKVGSSYVLHGHAGLGWAGLVQLGLHYITAWTQDDQNLDGKLYEGRVSVMGADARLTAGRFGHLYAGLAYTKAINAGYVGGVIQILNSRGGPGLVSEYLGPKSNDGDGSLTTFGFQYDLSLSRLIYGELYKGRNPDVRISLFGIGTKVRSDDPNYDDVLKLKGGAEVTYAMASWFALAGRGDMVRQDNRYNRRSFDILTARLLFHTGWLSRDEFAIQYSRFFYGREVYAESGYPPVDDPTLNPDRHVFSLSATFWW